MKKQHWFDFIEYFSLIGLGAGSVLSVVSKQILYTSAPLSFALLIGFVNRRRVEQVQEQKLIDSLASLEHNLSKNLQAIDQKVHTMPTPEMVGDVRQSILRHHRDEIKNLYEYIRNIKHNVEIRINSLEQTNSSETRDEIVHLQLQYTEIYDTLTKVSASLKNVATHEQIAEVDQSFVKLTSDVNQIQSSFTTLEEYNKHTLANLHDQVNHLNRQLRSLPPQVDASSIKREVSELVRVVADLVPKRDLNAVVADLRAMQQRQTTQLKLDEALQHDIEEVRQRLHALSDLPQLKSQFEESFNHEIQTINRQLRTLYHSPELRTKIEEVLKVEFGNLQARLAEQLPSIPYDLVFDLAAEGESHESVIISGSRKVLTDAIESTNERLILIWPWSSYTELDSSLLRQFEQLLRNNTHLDVGWCHVSDRHGDRFLNIINRRWSLSPLNNNALQGTLKRLLALKRHYPKYFRFKILGTVENFLISDSSFAVLGLNAHLQTQTFLRNVELKLRTTDDQVIQNLIERFDETEPPIHDVNAYWNRAVTRYDLGDKVGALKDLEIIISQVPTDATAYNLSGIIHHELNNTDEALENLSRSIELEPNQCSAYCNRGYIHSEQGDQHHAINDFNLAIQAKPDSALAYFYRGAAVQKLEDFDGAIKDYSESLLHAPDSPIVLYQRGTIHQTLGQYQEAQSDLEHAAKLFKTQGSSVNAQKAQDILIRIQQHVTTSTQCAQESALTETEHESSDHHTNNPIVGQSDTFNDNVPLSVEDEPIPDDKLNDIPVQSNDFQMSSVLSPNQEVIEGNPNEEKTEAIASESLPFFAGQNESNPYIEADDYSTDDHSVETHDESHIDSISGLESINRLESGIAEDTINQSFDTEQVFLEHQPEEQPPLATNPSELSDSDYPTSDLNTRDIGHTLHGISHYTRDIRNETPQDDEDHHSDVQNQLPLKAVDHSVESIVWDVESHNEFDASTESYLEHDNVLVQVDSDEDSNPLQTYTHNDYHYSEPSKGSELSNEHEDKRQHDEDVPMLYEQDFMYSSEHDDGYDNPTEQNHINALNSTSNNQSSLEDEHTLDSLFYDPDTMDNDSPSNTITPGIRQDPVAEESTDISSSDNNQMAQLIDEESISDFCQRFST